MDLGISSMQVDARERGFSYSYDAPLDMRMDPSQELDARTIVNEWPEARLAAIIREYGEERYARRIAREIVRRRERAPIETTTELVDAIKRAVPTPAQFAGGHPARRTFQAIRIAVNDELGLARARAARGVGAAAPRRPHGGDLLPLARGPAGEALLRRARARLRLPAGAARLRLRPRARGRAGQPPRRCARARARSPTTRAPQSGRLRAAIKLARRIRASAPKGAARDAAHDRTRAPRGRAAGALGPRRATRDRRLRPPSPGVRSGTRPAARAAAGPPARSPLRGPSRARRSARSAGAPLRAGLHAAGLARCSTAWCAARAGSRCSACCCSASSALNVSLLKLNAHERAQRRDRARPAHPEREAAREGRRGSAPATACRRPRASWAS